MEILGDSLFKCCNAGQDGACSECSVFVSDFCAAKNVQLALVQGQLLLRVDTIEKPGLQKDHPTRTCIPRTLSSAWKIRRMLTDLQVKESQHERGRFGYGRAQCRGLMILMKSRMVRKSTEQKCCSAYVMPEIHYPVCTAAAPSAPDFASSLLCKAPVV